MKTVLWSLIVGFCFVLLVPDANALPLRSNRIARRSAITSGSDSDTQTEQAEQETAAAEEEPAAADAATTAATETEADAATSQPIANDDVLPIGMVVNTLPEGCTKEIVGDVEYSYDGKNYYRAAFQGNQLVYVTGQP